MCSERAGSNLITKMFDAHPKVCGPSPKHILNPVLRNLFRYKDLNNVRNWEYLLNDIYQLIEVNFSIWKKEFTRTELFDLAPPGEISTLLKNIFNAEALQNKKQHIFIKENQIYQIMTYILTFFPRAKFVYQVRDPRDMALSWKKSTIHHGGVIQAARRWKLDQQQFAKEHFLLKQQKRSILVKYEELITDPEMYLRDICRALDIEYSSSMIKFYQIEETKINANKNIAWSNLSRKVISQNKNKYLDELTEKEIKCIEKICYPEMSFFNYQTENSISELDNITEKELKEFDTIEQELYLNKENIRQEVYKNIEAKKVFYHKIMN
ncbi:sulfotransferase [Gracilibacillus salitolerans]|uniref:Sulfotransferase n=2 Tax=Gracilibacillus salitolerans TaxID=2663022 RepID=A0A5Q2TSF9_9BACI|nr:sulfotransferase [Gracilibacillus salitolerans]